MLFMHLLVGIRELSCTHLKKKIEKKKKANNSPNSKQHWQEHHQIPALRRNRLTESHGISSAIRAPSRKILPRVVHTIATKWTS